MKETFKSIVIIIIFLFIVGRVGWWENHYYRDAIVISVDDTMVTVKDTCGYVWDFESDYAKQYPVGINVRMLMDTHTTDSIHDDIIEKVKIK